MSLITIGINHRTAAVHLREKLAFAPESIGEALQSLSTHNQIHDAVILSTCNRTELYVHRAEYQSVLQWLYAYHGLTEKELSDCLYCHRDAAVVEHLMRVSCGLDSLVLGEPQILGQIKQAFAQAKAAKTVSSTFERLFQHTFSVAKQIRTQTSIGSMSISVAYVAVTLAKQIFESLEKTQVLLIGAGETIELVARHLKEHNVCSMVVANRTITKAQLMTEKFGGKAIALSDIPHYLGASDIVISSTASTLPILGKGLVEKTMKQRKHRPIFFVDLAVPRDIEPEIAELDDAFLYTVDDLQDIVKKNIDTRQSAALQAEEMTKKYADQFMLWLKAQDSIDYVRRYRHQSIQTKEELLVKAQIKLQRGESAQDVLQELAHQLTNRLIHAPTQAITRASQKGDKIELARLKALLDIQLEQDK